MAISKAKPRLKNLDDLFNLNSDNPSEQNASDAETQSHNKQAVSFIAIENLVPFKNHPFKLYEGERFADMVESVKANGVIIPVIIRPLNDDKYEILSGHNRVEAAKAAELETIPAIIQEDLSDDEALLIVTETNLRQRSFADLSHSEKATTLAVHHEAVKNQGRRTDLINEIENLLKNSVNLRNHEDFDSFSPLGKRLNNVVKLGENYGLSKNSVARYLRINKLIDELKKRVDTEEISIRAAVELSYLPEQDQKDLFIIMQENSELKIDMKKAELLREFSESTKLTDETISAILNGIAIKKRNRASLPVQSIKIKGKILSKYFKPEQKPEEIEAQIIKAIEFYMAHENAEK